jgi:DNA-binding NarL/FixJ family response regulator
VSGGDPLSDGSIGPPATPTLKIGLVDGDRMSTFGLRRRLNPYVDRVGVVDQLAEADLVLVDPHLPMAAITDVSHLVDSMSTNGVVVHTWASAAGPSGPGSLRAAGWPLRGWLSKSLSADTLVDALERIHRGSWVSLDAPTTISQLRPVPNAPATSERLTPREGQIISLIAAGLTNQQIAERSYLSINSVKTYIRSAYRKIGVSRRTQAVVWAVQHEPGGWPARSAGTDER